MTNIQLWCNLTLTLPRSIENNLGKFGKTSLLVLSNSAEYHDEVVYELETNDSGKQCGHE